jgi:hypothetical protein
VFTSERVLGEYLSLLIILFGVFSDSLRSVVGHRSVLVLSCIFFSPFIFFKEKKKKIYFKFFLFESFSNKKEKYCSFLSLVK